MKFIIFICLFTLSANCFAWSCEDNFSSFSLDHTPLELELSRNVKIDAHLKKASDIFLGKVISGKVNDDDIEFQMNIIHNFKGDKKKAITILNPIDSLTRKLSLGDNYLIFLYGDNVVDFCSLTIHFWSSEMTIEILKNDCLLYTSPSPRDLSTSRMPSSA